MRRSELVVRSRRRPRDETFWVQTSSHFNYFLIFKILFEILAFILSRSVASNRRQLFWKQIYILK